MFPKPSRPLALVRHERKLVRKAVERKAKDTAKQRDWHKCRWPRCEFSAISQPKDAAHLEAAGMGGDPASERMRRDNLITLCRLHHQGPVSLHSGDLRIEPMTGLGTDGPVQFLRRDDDGRWYVVAEETAIGVYRRD